jgi:hypothetical protein
MFFFLKKNILIPNVAEKNIVVRKRNSERNKKLYPPPPCKLNGRSLIPVVTQKNK